MDDTTTLSTLKSQVKQFCEDRDWDQYHNAKELAIGIITEAGELLDHFRFRSPGQVDELFTDMDKRNEIEEEMADILYFLVRLAERYNIDLSQAFGRKMVMNEEKYPAEKVRGQNKKYTEY